MCREQAAGRGVAGEDPELFVSEGGGVNCGVLPSTNI